MKLERFLINEKGVPISDIRKMEQYSDALDTPAKVKDFETIYKKLRKDCAPFLKETKNYPIFLYRNIKTSDQFGVRPVRMDRRPRDTGKKIHKVFDDVLDDLYGFRGRSQAIFCSGDDNWDSVYGDGYIIFPIGKFKYIWSPDTRDSYKFVGYNGMDRMIDTYFKKEAEKIWKDVYGEGGKGKWLIKGKPYKNKTREGLIQDYIKQYPYLDKKTVEPFISWIPDRSLDGYMTSLPELYDKGSSLNKDEKKLVRDVVEKSIDKLDYKNTDLVDGIRSYHEIMLQCDKYYYFNVHQFRYILSMGLFGNTLNTLS